MRKLNKGGVGEDLLFLGALCIIIFVFIIPERKLGPVQGIFNTNSWTTSNPNGNSNTTSDRPKADSVYSSNIKIDSGNAQYESDPFREYVIIESNGNNNPIDITGWILKNNKDQKTLESSGNIQHFASDIVTLPKAALYISPTDNNVFTDIVLNDGDKVVVTSGAIGIQSPYPVVSFRENSCSGYLQKLPEYTFNPSLELDCPYLKNEAGYSGLDNACKDYISGMGRCYTPKFDGLDQNRQACNGCVDGRSNFTQSCTNFLRQHATYEMCIDKHKNDSDFEHNTWRVFLGRSFEMWDNRDDIISLLDRNGKLANYLSY